MYHSKTMERLNYHHLLHFWMVARAARQLRLAQPIWSGQIRGLECALGEKLFERSGRGLRLTKMGRVVAHSLRICSVREARRLQETLRSNRWIRWSHGTTQQFVHALIGTGAFFLCLPRNDGRPFSPVPRGSLNSSLRALSVMAMIAGCLSRRSTEMA